MAWRDPWDDVGRDNALRAQQTQGQVGTLAALANMQNNALVQRRNEEQRQLGLQQQMQLREILGNPNMPAEARDRALLSMGQPGLQALNALSTIDQRNEMASLQKAREAEARRRAAEAERQSGALTQLQDLLTPKPLPSGNMPQMAMSEAEAIRMAQEAQARGQPARVTVPDMAKARGLAAIVDPKAAVTELMKTGRPKSLGDMVRATAGGYVKEGPDGTPEFVRTESEHPPPKEPKVTPYSDIGRIRQDVANGLISSQEGDATIKALGEKKSLVIDRGVIGNMHKFRGEYDRNPEVKRVNAIESTVAPIAEYMVSRKTKMDPVADNALVKAYLSLTHAKGDQISNMDRRELEKLASLDKRFGNAIESFFRGKNLADEVANSMWQEISSRYKVLDGQRKKVREDILKRAKDARIPGRMIFSDAPEEE